MKVREVIRKLEADGWVLVRIRGKDIPAGTH
jgi:predicted RNA binding protein YcfA (HicA-like mRNA interferase family)